MNLSKSIRYYCEKQKWTLSKLAKEASVPVQTLHGWTTGRKSVQLDQLKRVANALKVSVHSLAYGEPDPNEDQSDVILKEIFNGDVRVTLHRIERKRKRVPT